MERGNRITWKTQEVEEAGSRFETGNLERGSAGREGESDQDDNGFVNRNSLETTFGLMGTTPLSLSRTYEGAPGNGIAGYAAAGCR